MIEFGATAGKIGFVIALASVIGVCLMESGAADKIVRKLLQLLGERRTGLALLASGFVLAIPVFFDTVFLLLVPLARALALRSGKNYLFYVLAIGGGGVITHSLVAPTPGPLLMAETLRIDLGFSILTGIAAGLLPAAGVIWMARRMNARQPVPLREAPGAPLADLKTLIDRPDHALPSFFVSILPVALPVFLIGLASVWGLVTAGSSTGGPDALARAIEFLGNKNVALSLGTAIALRTLAVQKGLTREKLLEVLGPPLETAGIIILITSAGGAFGAMIKHSGVGASIEALTSDGGMSYLLLAWLIAAVMKIAQGSGTVSMITTAGMMFAIIGDGSGLAYPPVLVFLAIGFGSLFVSWMNDSGFWVVCKLSGFTEQETLKSWTVLLAGIAVMGLIEVLILSQLFGRG
jgi:GntP family gluconate:H+ symporter